MAKTREGCGKTSKKALMEVSSSKPEPMKTDTDPNNPSNSSEKSRVSRKRVKKDSTSETETIKAHNDPTTSSSNGEKSSSSPSKKKLKTSGADPDCRFLGEPISIEEARKRWPARYEQKIQKKVSRRNANKEEEKLLARCHYLQAEVEGTIFNLYDCAYIQGEDGGADYIGRILEFFETIDNKTYFTAQWFYRAEDTVIKKHANLIDERRVFVSELKDDNPLECIISKLKIERVAPNVDLVVKNATIPPCDFYYDMSYSLQFTTFANISEENTGATTDSPSPVSNMTDCDASRGESKLDSNESYLATSSPKSEMTLLDLYSGCGAMSTGLCLGAALSGVNLITRWAVDLSQYACQSLKLNHPETEVRNESADDFLSLLKEWEKLCKKFSLVGTKIKDSRRNNCQPNDVEDNEDVAKVPAGEFEVGKLVGIRYGDPKGMNKTGLYFKVRWKGYGSNEDTWEPRSGLSKCQKKIEDFITSAYNSKLLPLPGDVDVICGGPPCQGISGYNRFRNTDDPLEDPKNKQVAVFMNIVEHLKPRYVLMENVVDIVKLCLGSVGRYALSRIVSMNYQARMGMMTAGCYGLPQFRMRVFLWGAHPTEILCVCRKLPQYPLPTHKVVVRGGGLSEEFKESLVAYEENKRPILEDVLLLRDAISDLPQVTNHETNDEMHYGGVAKTEFQKFIRLSKNELMGSYPVSKATSKAMLFDHRPLQLNADDYERVCRVPKKKGANFRDFPGVILRDNKVEWDPSIGRVFLSSGKPLVPDYAMSFKKGTSPKPFGRLWWDETVSTVVTRAEPHNQVIIHPEQDRVLSIRENARLQGFPDYYKLCGPVKERYIQVGNAVAVPAARALGYALGLASKGICNDQPLFTLPPKFSFSTSRTATGNATKSSDPKE